MDSQQILASVQDAIAARRVFGDAIKADGVTVIPVSVIRGGGGTGRRSENGSVGFGVHARPAGVYVIRDGDASWHPAIDVNRVILGGQIVAFTAILMLRPLLIRWLARPSASSELAHVTH